MEVKDNEPVRKKSSNDVMRKKLEAELRATEEIARIKQNVIEKRLAVELATLEQEPPDGGKVGEVGATVRATHPKSVSKTVPKPAPPPAESKGSTPVRAAPPKMVPKPAVPPAVAETRKARVPKKAPVQEPEAEKPEEEATTSATTGVKLQKSPFSLRFRRSSEKSPKSSLITPSFLTFSRKHQLPEFFTPCQPEDSDDEEEGDEDEDSQPRRKGSFLKGVIQKWKKRMRSEDRERE